MGWNWTSTTNQYNLSQLEDDPSGKCHDGIAKVLLDDVDKAIGAQEDAATKLHY